MARLRRSHPSSPGISRRRRGRGFEYRDQNGNLVHDGAVLDRIRGLAIPPAWKDVWICPYPMGHLQAIGTDAAGRKQYRYHDKWRERRDQEKFDAMIEFARALPGMREAVARDLRGTKLTRQRVLACAVRLLDRGFFRVGGEDYAAENDSYGLATLEKRHVRVGDGSITFDYQGKGGQRRVQRMIDPEIYPIIEKLKRRRGGSEDLLAYQVGGGWRDVRSEDVNEYIKEVAGEGFSAKDFRTWNATVLAAVALPCRARRPDPRRRASGP